MPGQPPSTSLRMEAPASAPSRSKLRCSSSTRVACGPCAMNLTSTSELTVVSGFQLLLRSQLITKRSGGSHTSTLPTSACEPSSLNSYQRPPRPRLQHRGLHWRLADGVGARPPAPEAG